MLRVGIAGIGFMGWIHWLAWHRVPGVRIEAIATMEPERRAGDWRAIKGNFGPPGERVDLRSIRVYESVDQLVGDGGLDLIDICLPTAAHPFAAIAALRAGTHVLCEKPLGLSLPACDEVIAVSKASSQQLMVAHVLPFFPEYAWALAEVRSGRHGRLLGGSFKRVISDPAWLPKYYDPAVIGGPLLDLHVHDAHLIRLLFGMPESVSSRGRLRNGVAEYAVSSFGFAERHLVVTSTMGVIRQQGRPFTHGFELQLERATIHFESASFADGNESMPVKLLADDGQVIRPTFPVADPLDGFVAELTEVRDCSLNNRPSTILAGDLARDAVQICEWQAEALRKQA